MEREQASPVMQDLHTAIAGYADHAGMNRLAE